MYTNHDDIVFVLSGADSIYCEEDGKIVPLAYSDEYGLVRASPFGGSACKPISDVKQIVFHEDSDAWEVIWRV